MDRKKLLDEIMRIDFACFDLRLYLNTHPNETDVIAHYNNMINEGMAFRAEYEREYGPLTQMSKTNEMHFDWINQPWPWERPEKGER